MKSMSKKDYQLFRIDRYSTKNVVFSVRLPTRCVEIIDKIVEAELYSNRGECVEDNLRYALREGFHKKMLPACARGLTPAN